MLLIVLTGILAFYVAWNLGANDVANSMGTSVGSKAITLRQALVIAGILEFSGAVLFGRQVSQTLATEIVNPNLFAAQPQLLVLGMMAVLMGCGLWLQIATSKGWPVSSSHGVVGAIAGFSCIAAGIGAVDWANISRISITWVLTPLASGIIAAGFYSIIKYSILDRPNPIDQLREWIPWLSAIVLSIFGVIVLPSIFDTPLFANLPFPKHDLTIATGGIAAIALTSISWHQLDGGRRQEVRGKLENSSPREVEQILARFQVISACFVAFAHGSNDVGNAIAPLAAIVYIINTGSIPLTSFGVPLWILLLGGCGIVAGLAIWGKKVIATIGENIIPLQPSSGFCAEIATATTVLIASKLGLPVSTSHALVGGVIGIGLIQNWRNVRFSTVKSIALAWVITIPVSAVLGAAIFVCLRFLFA
ncbi:MAG TPA: phosphate permease [Cyanobacteria bacterium UBA11149]|nr:phosphate permease [Cyanobacteria bacterium UBA11367]HBE61135.1 phosphate permease [Cyanobacteria bacterium UBA11366]HBK66154.1 phosphate permease [Cyanobacteria bacterium UBA11166]HBR74676.1 phosphate permease [Cyanobacteria bacterium UBA11159]HBS70092.1 phosphate permease [Cyanobacteria bacterium UBA11153]HBW92209.1 phosphate permease [Cyanobacteria bacterium UBA11149]HCA95202.1 phosphate permease [Cyanobacteria bacterium UBA9226]